MPNIFDGFAKSTDSEIADQIAFLETVNFGSVLKPTGQKVHRAIFQFFKSIWSIFGNTLKVPEPLVRKVEEVVEAKRKELDALSREQLDIRLRIALQKRSGAPNEISDDILSAKVIDEAARVFKIEKELTPALKADLINLKLIERVFKGLQEKLNKQDSQQNEEIAKEIDAKLRDIPSQQREKIQEVLQVDKLTGESVLKTLSMAGTPAVIIGVLNAAGFGAYVALTTIIHAIFTSILGITLPFAVYMGSTTLLSFLTGPIGWILILGIGSWQMIVGVKRIDREILAQCVWMAVGNYGGYFTPLDNELPSWIPNTNLQKREEIEKEDNKYTESVRDFKKAVDDLTDSNEQIKKLKKRLATSESSLELEAKKRQKAEHAIHDLKTRQNSIEQELENTRNRVGELENTYQDDSVEVKKARRELELKTRELSSIQNKLHNEIKIVEYASGEIDKIEAELRQMKNENDILKAINNEYKQKEQKAKLKTDSEEECRRRQLEDLWKIHFPRFSFQPGMLREAAKLRHSARCALEKVLRELHDSKDPRSLSINRGKIVGKDHDHLKVKLPGVTTPARLDYRVLSDKAPGIELIKFYKHNEKYQQ